MQLSLPWSDYLAGVSKSFGKLEVVKILPSLFLRSRVILDGKNLNNLDSAIDFNF